MSKVFKAILVIILTVATLGVLGYGIVTDLKGGKPDKLEGWQKVRVADEALYAENYEYVDYARDIVIDYDKHPALKDQGLFWCYYDAASDSVLKLDADSEEGVKLVDTSKPTIINVHGMMADGHYNEEKYWVNTSIGTPEELGVEYPVQMTKFWLDAGYNVGIYNYNKFASEGAAFQNIEEKMWATNGVCGIRYRLPDGSLVEDVIPYTVAELFVADYLRAVNKLPDDFGKAEIRIAAHSMGGELSAAALFLLTELADANVKQIDHSKVPSRYMMEDTFFAVHLPVSPGKFSYGGQKGLVCRWSGKPIPSDDTGITTIEALKDLDANGIVMDYYSYSGSFLRGLISDDMRKDLVSVCAYIMMEPNYGSYNKGYSYTTEAHNGVRQYLLCSILNPYDPKVTDPLEMVKYAAALPTSEMAKLKGKCYYLKEGSDTITTADDVYIDYTSEAIKNG